jgi:hypothetical protein
MVEKFFGQAFPRRITTKFMPSFRVHRGRLSGDKLWPAYLYSSTPNLIEV